MDEHTKLSGPSALRDLLRTSFKPLSPQAPPDQFSKAFEAFAEASDETRRMVGRWLVWRATWCALTSGGKLSLEMKPPALPTSSRRCSRISASTRAWQGLQPTIRLGFSEAFHTPSSRLVRSMSGRSLRKTKDFTPSMTLICSSGISARHGRRFWPSLATFGSRCDQQVMCSTHSSLRESGADHIPAIASAAEIMGVS